MSYSPQSELHPGTELLNAFAEQALGTQEREQMLAHLATCGRCREVVFLAQEAALAEEPVAAVDGVPSKLPSSFGGWFGGWNLVWAGGLAAAAMALAVVSIYLLRPVPASETAKATRQAADQVTRAQVERPVPPAAPIAPTAPVPSAKPRPAPLRMRQPKPKADKLAGLAAAQPPIVSADANASSVVIPAETQENLPINGRNVQTLTSLAGSGRGQLSAGVVGGAAPAPKGYAAGAAREPKAMNFADHAQPQATAAAPAMQLVPPPQAQTPGSVSETVEVSSENAAIATEPVVSSAPITLHGAVRKAQKAQPALPSGLPAISSAESEGRRVALDSAGYLFFSRDAGVAWQAVAIQWTGKAVSVRSVKPAGFEMVNESGAVWSSADGLAWGQKH